MSDDKKKTLSASGSSDGAGRKTLQLKPLTAPAGVGRRAAGVVVQRKKKLILPGGAPAAEAPTVAKEAPKKKITAPSSSRHQGKDSGRLSAGERDKRARVLEEANKANAEKAARAAEEAKKRVVEEAARATTEAANQKQTSKDTKKAEEDEQKRVGDLEVKEKAEAAARVVVEAEEKAAKKTAPPAPRAPAAPVRREVERPAPAKRGRNDQPRRRSGRLTVTQALSGNMDRQRSLAALRRARAKEKRKSGGAAPAQKLYREVVVPDSITVAELANRMTEKTNDVIRALVKMDVMAGASDNIDQDVAELVVEEFGHSIRRVSESDVELDLAGPEDTAENMVTRAPVVTIMGHVDHGKTSILDALRKTDVTASEAGGITQHIGAYQVRMPSGDKITFLDTPGHAAFTAMRARGAQITDIVVLVVAADDSIMPQTIEAISHAKAAEVPIIVAINKIDAPGANPDKVRQDLLQHEVFVESMGGEVLDVEVSALKGTNLDKLEEAILLQAELLGLEASPTRQANGSVVEAKLDKGRGPVATVLVKRGTLKIGDVFVAGPEWGRVRAIMDDRGSQLKEAGPSMPVEVLGLSGTPGAGDEFVVVEDEAKARSVIEFRQRQIKEEQTGGPRASLEDMFEKLKEKEISSLPLLLKTDVKGSLEAILGSLKDFGTDEVEARFLHAGVGGITESDIGLAAASSSPVIGFNVRASRPAAAKAAQDGVEIRYYSVIYDLLDDVKAAMSGLLDPEMRETIIGSAEVLDIFSAGKTGKAAGCLVVDGIMKRGARARLLRDDTVIYTGDLGSLRRFKDDVKEVQSGVECGMNFENYNDIQKGDVIECFEVEQIERTL